MSTSNFDPPLTHVSAAFHIFSEFAKYFGKSFVDAQKIGNFDNKNINLSTGFSLVLIDTIRCGDYRLLQSVVICSKRIDF